ncbi:hypothetical protein EES40_08430 [Streptomyces sp. ADI93-02]|nr:hypothetical protein EES40_08430 [Streptomyces sp. ADI93-02]
MPRSPHGGRWSQVPSSRPPLGLRLIIAGATVVVTSRDGEKSRHGKTNTAREHRRTRTASRTPHKYRPRPVSSPPVSGNPSRRSALSWPTSPEPQPSISYSRRALRCIRDGRGALGAVKRLGSARRERRWSGPLGVVQLCHAEEFGELARRSRVTTAHGRCGLVAGRAAVGHEVDHSGAHGATADAVLAGLGSRGRPSRYGAHVGDGPARIADRDHRRCPWPRRPAARRRSLPTGHRPAVRRRR